MVLTQLTVELQAFSVNSQKHRQAHNDFVSFYLTLSNNLDCGNSSRETSINCRL